MISHYYRCVVDQPEQVTDRKDCENDARDAQCSFLRIHGTIL